jgi:hypothetical protein
VTGVLTDETPGYRPYVIGEPGRAPGLVVPRVKARLWNRKDTEVDGFRVDGPVAGTAVQVRAASVRGLSHRAYGKVRQDAYGVRVTEDGRHLIVAVADGLSSGELSHVAAEAVVWEGVSLLSAHLADGRREVDWGRFCAELVGAVERNCREDLRARGHADAATRPLPEVAALMAATASFAVLDMVPVDGAHPVTTGSIGDTSIWVLEREGRWRPTQPVKNDGAELHSSATKAVPLSADPLVATARVGPGNALLVMTDGVGDPLGHGTGEVGKRLGELWRTPPHELDFAAQVGFARKTYDDDRTVVALWPCVP